MQLWQKLKPSSIESVDVCIADFSTQRLVAEQKVNTVYVSASLGLSALLCMIFLVIFLQCTVKRCAYVHYLASHSHFFIMIIFIHPHLPLLKSYFRVTFLIFLLLVTTLVSNFTLFAFFLIASELHTSLSHSFES